MSRRARRPTRRFGRPKSDAEPAGKEAGGAREPRDVAKPGETVAFPKQAMTPLSFAKEVSVPVFEKTINVGPVSVDLDVAASAQIDGQLRAEIGAGTLTDPKVDSSGRGTARLHVPAAVLGALTFAGKLAAQGKLYSAFPAAKVTGKLDGRADASARGDATLDVAVTQGEDGTLAFDADGVLGGELTGSLDLKAGLDIELLGRKLWSADWVLAAQDWSSGAKVGGSWRARVSPGGVQADMVVDDSQLDTAKMVDAAFDEADVVQDNGEDNPWKCRAEGNNVVGDFKDFPWAGANGAPEYPTQPVVDHPANERLGLVDGPTVPRPSSQYRIIPGQVTKGNDGYTKQWRDLLAAQVNQVAIDIFKSGGATNMDDARELAKVQLAQEAGMSYSALELKGWHCHHIKEMNWGGAHSPSNLKFVPAGAHTPFTSWGQAHRAAMRRAVGIRV